MDNALALLVKPAQFDLSTPMLAAARLREADTSNALAQVQLQDAGDRRNALADYTAGVQAGDPKADQALAGQPDLYAHVVTVRGQMDEQRRKRFDEQALIAAKDAQYVAAIEDPTERAKAWKERLDQRRQEGSLDQAAYDKLSSQPPNSLMLSNVIKAGLSLEQAITLEQKDKDRAAGSAAIGALNTLTGGGSPGAPAPAAEAPRGIRNNNPLNIEAGDFTKGQPGFSGSDGRFAKFSTPAQGVAAADKLIENYGANQGINTVEGVINRWAPATENKTADYAAYVARQLGVKPGDKIDLADPATRSQLVAAMGHYENGRPITTGGPMTTSLNPDGERLQQALPALRSLRMMPGLPDTVQKGIDELVKNIEKENEPTSDMKEYRLYVKQEREAGNAPMKFFDWQTKLAQEKATKVTQVNKGEDSADKAMGERFGKKYGEYVDAGDAAFGQLGTLSTMRQLASDPNFSSGVLSEKLALPLKQVQVALGGDPKAAASMESFRALANKSVIDSMGGSLGTGFSNADRDFVVGQVPNIGNTKEGNEKLFQIMERVARRKIDVARMAQEYVQQKDPDTGKPRGRLDAGFDAKLSEWREKTPLFSEEERGDIKRVVETSLPQPGDVVDGWKFNGGDRSKRENWQQVPSAPAAPGKRSEGIVVAPDRTAQMGIRG